MPFIARIRPIYLHMPTERYLFCKHNKYTDNLFRIEAFDIRHYYFIYLIINCYFPKTLHYPIIAKNILHSINEIFPLIIFDA